MYIPPEMANAPILDYAAHVDEGSLVVYITPDRLLDAILERLYPAIAEGTATTWDLMGMIDGWPVMLVDATDPAWDAYRPVPEPEPEPEGEE